MKGLSWRSLIVAAVLCGFAWMPLGASGDLGSVQAAAGLSAASQAAEVWAGDAVLVYIENDEPLTQAGLSSRWGYMFYSPFRNQARAYSVQDGEVRGAETMAFRFDPPAVTPGWRDSDEVIRSAENGGGREFRKEFGGSLRSMFLMRGGLHEDKPGLTTWTVVYEADEAPPLFLVVDASSGKVKRKWRG